jgi:hypothetical protein
VYFEIARMLRAVLTIPDASVRTFQDYDEALAWLLKDRESDKGQETRDKAQDETEENHF